VHLVAGPCETPLDEIGDLRVSLRVTTSTASEIGSSAPRPPLRISRGFWDWRCCGAMWWGFTSAVLRRAARRWPWRALRPPRVGAVFTGDRLGTFYAPRARRGY